ncbi:MAG: hypothetical protein LBS65_08585 [Desulfovibrio sp.]|jgi:hypothetical protein|nr:hypothetical protein [Desulfovibrio sp.]
MITFDALKKKESSVAVIDVPGDTHTSPARYMEELGPLPDGALLERPAAPPPTLEQARVAKIEAIDADTSAAILSGFDYTVDDQILHFSYDAHDQQNFADTANAATLSMMGVPGIPESVTWNGWEITRDAEGRETGKALVRLVLTPESFLKLYMAGALAHKATQMEIGGRSRKRGDT